MSLAKDFRPETLQFSLEEAWGQGKDNAPRFSDNANYCSPSKQKAFWQTGFTYSQPFLINTFINYIDSPKKSSSNVGYALIGAYMLIFFGAAVSVLDLSISWADRVG